jgi:hypothetical protein
MAHVFVASDHRTDPYILKTLPAVLDASGHAYTVIHPLEKIVEAAELSAAAHGGSDLAILVHSTETQCGESGPRRVLKKLRELPDHLLFRNAVKAKSLPALVIAKNVDLAPGEPKELADTGWVKLIDPSALYDEVRAAITELIFNWRTDLLRELECVGYAVTVGARGHLDVNPTFSKKRVEGEILRGKVSLTRLQRSKYVVLSSDVFKAAASYRQLAFLIEYFRLIAAKKGTKPEEVFQKYFTANPDFLFAQGFSHIFPKPRLVLPEDPSTWLEPDFVTKPRVSPQLGSKWEILDIKLPDVEIVRGSTFHQTFTAKLFSALQQLGDYHRYFDRDDAEAKRQLIDAFEFHPKNPKLAVLIGRSSPEYAEAIDHASRTFPVPRVEIISYDEILERQSLYIANEWEWIGKIT